MTEQTLKRLSQAQLPIGIFDSGVGGLTVMQAIREQMPNEDLIYLGDTARVPYGTKSPESVQNYARQAAAALIKSDIKALVIACNTASAVAVDMLAAAYSNIPVIGVVEPGAEACVKFSKSGHIAVLATESTVRGGAYPAAIGRLRPEARVISQACSLLVALAEEGWTHGSLVEQIIAEYIQPLLAEAEDKDLNLDCLVLGCTHFPVLKDAIAAVCPAHITLVDSAHTTAQSLQGLLAEAGLAHPDRHKTGQVAYQVTDGVERFARVAAYFTGEQIALECIELIDIHSA